MHPAWDRDFRWLAFNGRPGGKRRQVLISYIDVSDGREARRNVLSKHYGFECRCDRCKLEQRASLKSALKQSQDRRR